MGSISPLPGGVRRCGSSDPGFIICKPTNTPADSSTGFTPVSVSVGNLMFRHTLSVSHASDLQAAYEWSTDLMNWNASEASAGRTTVTFGTPVVMNAGPPCLVEVTVTGHASRRYLRPHQGAAELTSSSHANHPQNA